MTTDIAPNAHDWDKIARQAVLGAGKRSGQSKLKVRTVKDVCMHIASGLPRKTAAALAGTSDRQVKRWIDERPTVSDAIERAIEVGKARYFRKIDADSSFKAAQAMLEYMDPDMRGGDLAASRGGPSIQVVVNVPVPQAPDMVDITPQIDIESGGNTTE